MTGEGVSAERQNSRRRRKQKQRLSCCRTVYTDVVSRPTAAIPMENPHCSCKAKHAVGPEPELEPPAPRGTGRGNRSRDVAAGAAGGAHKPEVIRAI